MTLQNISPANLIVGDTIVDDKGRMTKVKTLEECASHRKGCRRVHVNEKDCYDGAATIQVTSY